MKDRKLGYKVITYTLMLVLLGGALYLANAIEVPLGAQTITEGADSTVNASNYAPATHDAIAGNITELNITGRSQTKHWQGYYGEVTGVIVLDDAFNWTMYEWPNPEPKGEIYATVNNTPNWQTVRCFDFTDGADGNGLGNVTSWEDYYNMTFNNYDGIDETFNMTMHPTIDVGDQTIFNNTCPSTFTYINDTWQTDRFVQILLTDENGRIIFTTLLENRDKGNHTDIVGYDGRTHDFQMLVAEDGTSRTGPGGTRNILPTTYYFYIDIE